MFYVVVIDIIVSIIAGIAVIIVAYVNLHCRNTTSQLTVNFIIVPLFSWNRDGPVYFF